MLNGDGGIIMYGVRTNGIVYGEKISRKEEDNLKNTIDTAMKRIIPYVGGDKYKVKFIKVSENDHRSSLQAASHQVLKIKVEPGDPYEMYEDPNHEVIRTSPWSKNSNLPGHNSNRGLSKTPS